MDDHADPWCSKGQEQCPGAAPRQSDSSSYSYVAVDGVGPLPELPRQPATLLGSYSDNDGDYPCENLSEMLSAVVECPLDLSWVEGPTAPSQTSIQGAVGRLRDEMAAARAVVVHWRLQLPPESGIRWDRRMHSVIHCADELEYYDRLPPFQMLAAWLREVQLDVQHRLNELQSIRWPEPFDKGPRPSHPNYNLAVLMEIGLG